MKAALVVGLLFLAMLLLALAGCAPPEDEQLKAARICTDAGLIPSTQLNPPSCVIPEARIK